MKRLSTTKLRYAIVAVGCTAVGVAAGIAGAAAAPSGTSGKSKAARAPLSPPGPGRPGGMAVHEQAVVLDRAGNAFITATIDNGTVSSVSADSLTVKEAVGNVTYKTVTLTIPSGATVLRDFQKASLSKLKPGDRVHVTQSSDGTTVIADDAIQGPPAGVPGRPPGAGGRFAPRGPWTGHPGPPGPGAPPPLGG